jgi:hypothetical protein
MEVASYVMFFLGGLGFGFAAPGGWKWVPLAVPLALFVIAVLQEGGDGTVVIRLVVALLITIAGVLLGALLAQRSGPPRKPLRVSSRAPGAG